MPPERPPTRIETSRLLLRCREPDAAAALRSAIDRSLDPLRARTPEGEPGDTLVFRMRSVGRMRGEEWRPEAAPAAVEGGRRARRR